VVIVHELKPSPWQLRNSFLIIKVQDFLRDTQGKATESIVNDVPNPPIHPRRNGAKNLFQKIRGKTILGTLKDPVQKVDS